MQDALIWLNGEISSPAEAKVSVFDRGFLFGDGIYETGKSVERCFLLMEDHLARLRRSAGKLAIEVPWTDEFIKQGLYETARAFGQDNVYFRTIVTRGLIDHVGLDAVPTSPPTLVHIIQELPDLAPMRERGFRLLTSSIHRNSARAQDPNIKTSNYLNSLLALQDVRARGADDAILCDPVGNITEGTTFSIFGVRSADEIVTPSLDCGILDSITRRHVIEVARDNGFTVTEGFFSLPQFLECREIFVASSIREVIGVKRWDNREFAQIPGPVTQKLADKFFERVSHYIATHEKF